MILISLSSGGVTAGSGRSRSGEGGVSRQVTVTGGAGRQRALDGAPTILAGSLSGATSAGNR